MSIPEIAQFVSALATVAATGILLLYTIETKRLRKAAESQLDATNNLFERSKEASIKPVLTVDHCERREPGITLSGALSGNLWPRKFIGIRNVGAVPAFAVSVEVPNQKNSLSFS